MVLGLDPVTVNELSKDNQPEKYSFKYLEIFPKATKLNDLPTNLDLFCFGQSSGKV